MAVRVPQRPKTVGMPHQDRQAIVVARHGNEVETKIENESADRGIVGLPAPRLGNPREVARRNASGQFGEFLRSASGRQLHEPDMNGAALDCALYLLGRLGMDDMPPRCHELIDTLRIGLERNEKDGTLRLQRIENGTHLLPPYRHASRACRAGYLDESKPFLISISEAALARASHSNCRNRVGTPSAAALPAITHRRVIAVTTECPRPNRHGAMRAPSPEFSLQASFAD